MRFAATPTKLVHWGGGGGGGGGVQGPQTTIVLTFGAAVGKLSFLKVQRDGAGSSPNRKQHAAANQCLVAGTSGDTPSPSTTSHPGRMHRLHRFSRPLVYAFSVTAHMSSGESPALRKPHGVLWIVCNGQIFRKASVNLCALTDPQSQENVGGFISCFVPCGCQQRAQC